MTCRFKAKVSSLAAQGTSLTLQECGLAHVGHALELQSLCLHLEFLLGPCVLCQGVVLTL